MKLTPGCMLKYRAILRSRLKKQKINFFLPQRDMTHGPLKPEASMLLMNYGDHYIWLFQVIEFFTNCFWSVKALSFQI